MKSPTLASASLSCLEAVAAVSAEVPVREQEGGEEAPGIEQGSEPQRRELGPDRRPPDVDQVLTLRLHSPPRHEHRDVHRSQGEHRVEKGVAVRHCLELLNGPGVLDRAPGLSAPRLFVRLPVCACSNHWVILLAWYVPRAVRHVVTRSVETQGRAPPCSGSGERRRCSLLAMPNGPSPARAPLTRRRELALRAPQQGPARTVLVCLVLLPPNAEELGVGPRPECGVDDRDHGGDHGDGEGGLGGGLAVVAKAVAGVVAGLRSHGGVDEVHRVQSDDGRGEEGA